MTGDGREYPAAVRVGVGVVVWRGDRVLLVRRGRAPRAGEWGLPGGGQEVGETVFEAAEREVAEETGIRIAPTGIITVVDSITPDEAGRTQYHYTLVEVAAEWQSGEPVAADDVDDVRWVALDELDELVAWDETRRVIRLSAASRPPTPPKLRARPDVGRLMRSPLGSLIARPWLDDVTLRLLADWMLPMSRAWAAAQEAAGDIDRFCTEVPVDPSKVTRSNWLARSLEEVDRAAARADAAEERWRRELFGRGPADPADMVRAEEERLDAAHALAMTRLRFAYFARAHRLAACRWEIPTEEEVAARHGARLADPARAYALPEPGPAVTESRRVASDLGIEYWLRFPCPEPDIGGECWARVFEPAGIVDPPTVIYLHGICIEADHVRGPLREVESLCRRGIRVVAVEAPWHGRRRPKGRYGGEMLVARTPLGVLDHFSAHVREAGILTRWARRTSRGPVGWSGISMGAFASQLAAVHAGCWPEAARADALLLFTTSEGIQDIALTGAFAKAFGVDRVLLENGWTAEKLARWRPLTDPAGDPAMGAENVFMVLGSVDTIAPFEQGMGIARRWRVPENQVYVRSQGHFSVPAGLLADEAPVEAFATHLQRLNAR